MLDGILETWRIHDEINQFLLEQIPEEGFAAATLLKNGQKSKGRTVARAFAHMHEARTAHLGRDFMKGVPRFEAGATPGRAELLEAFRASGSAVSARLAQIVERGDRIKDWGT